MKITLVCMQKNEGSLLRFWVDYHGKIFGNKSLIIIDDQSDSAETIEILKEVEDDGVTVIRPLFSVFENKGALVSEIIKNNASNSDWFFPTDCDEFLAVDTLMGGVRSDFGDFVSELSRCSADVNLLRINKSFYNIPGKPGFFYKSGTRKVIVRGGFDVELDKGFHLYDWTNGVSVSSYGEIIDTDLIHFHMHNKPFELLIESTKNKMKSRLCTFEKDEILSYRGDGMHLIKYLLMDEGEYLESFASKTCVDFRGLFSSLGINLPY